MNCVRFRTISTFTLLIQYNSMDDGNSLRPLSYCFNPISTPALPDPGKDFLCIELQETRLVISWSVEDQMCEAEFDIGANLFHMFFWITGDEPAAVGLISNSCCLPFHFTRIMDTNLVFCWQG